jgi:hypothetical protein
VDDEAPLPVGDRPFTALRYRTVELPDTPTRTFRIPAHAWREAPDELLRLGDDLGEPVEYKRRIGRYLLWRAGPPVGDSWYLAIDATDLRRRFRFRLAGRAGHGTGPDGVDYERFREWKRALLDDITPGREPDEATGARDRTGGGRSAPRAPRTP